MTNINFLGIGAQKAGTSWLFEVLNCHPQVWLHPLKEIHYFDCKYGVANIELTRKQRYLGLKRELSKLNANDILNLSKLEKIRILSLTKTSFGDYDDHMYLSLFQEANACSIVGEITPEYSALPEAGMKHIQSLLGCNVKILYMIRNPAARAWSMFKMHCANNKLLGLKTTEKIYEAITKPNFLQQSDMRTNYSLTIQLIEKFFDNIHYVLYVDFCSNPLQSLEKICNFLLIEYKEEYFSQIIHQRINLGKTLSLDLPIEILNFLSKRYIEQNNYILEKFNLDRSQFLK